MNEQPNPMNQVAPVPPKEPMVSPGLLWTLIIVVVAAAGYFGWNYYSQSKTPTETPAVTTTTPTTTPTASTADWKTYTNDTYGFSFKYPKSWFTDTSSTDYTVLVSNYDKASQYNKSNSPEDFLSIGVMEYTAAAQTSNQKNLISQTVVGDVTVYSLRNSESASDSKIVVRKVGKFIANGKTFEIWAGSGDAPVARTQKELTYFDQIIPTFQFTSASTTPVVTP